MSATPPPQTCALGSHVSLRLGQALRKLREGREAGRRWGDRPFPTWVPEAFGLPDQLPLRGGAGLRRRESEVRTGGAERLGCSGGRKGSPRRGTAYAPVLVPPTFELVVAGVFLFFNICVLPYF